jgi:hypothetical protein
MQPIRIAVVADIHNGGDVVTKRGSAALPLLRRFAAQAADADAIIDLGDRISDEEAATDARLERQVAECFAPLDGRRFHVCGNHDVAHLSLAENETILQAPVNSRSVDLGPLRLAFWQPDVALTSTRPLQLGAGDLDSLQRILDDERPTLLVSHPPVSGQAQVGNHWFENNPAHATYLDSLPEIRAVIAAAPCPVIAISGHVHWNSLTIVDGTPHLTLQSLTETCTTEGFASGCTALATVEDGVLRWRVGGTDPFAVDLPFGAGKRRWRRALPQFTELAAAAE